MALSVALLLAAGWAVLTSALLFNGNAVSTSAVTRLFELQAFYEQQGIEYRRAVTAARAEADRLRADLQRLETAVVTSQAAASQTAQLLPRLAELSRRQSQIETRQSAVLRVVEQVSGVPAANLAATSPVPAQRPEGLGRARSLGDNEPVENWLINPDPDQPDADEDMHGSLTAPEGQDTDDLGAARSAAGRSPSDAAGDVSALLERAARLEQAQVTALRASSRALANRAAVLRVTAEAAGRDLSDIAEPLRLRAAAAIMPITRSPLEDGSEFGVALSELRTAAGMVVRLAPSVRALPIYRPVSGDVRVTSRFGPRSDPFLGTQRLHAGQDFAAAIGTPVRATGSGVVLSAGVAGGYGNLVQIDHGGGLVTRYAHLSDIRVQPGQPVSVGQLVGLSGSTGRSTGPHLHYETRVRDVPRDPMPLLQVGERIGSLLPAFLSLGPTASTRL